MQDLLKKLKENNISISLENNNLKVRFNGTSLSADLLEELKANKKRLIEYLSGLGKQGLYMKIEPVAKANDYPLSSSQFRLWLLSRLTDSNVAYNMPGMYVFEGDLNRNALEYAFNELIVRHEILRTVFREDGQGQVRQFIISPDNTGFKIEHIDVRQEEDKEECIRQLAREKCGQSFDLVTWPLMRASLFWVEDKKWLFTYVMHHIISDGWSMHILLQELLLLYNAFSKGQEATLPPLRIQYKDYAAWQQAQLLGTEVKQHKAWWLKQFEGELPVLQLQGHYVRPPVKTFNGDAIRTVINLEAGAALKALAYEQGSTLFMGLLASVAVLLYAYSGQEDIIIGTPILGREHIDLENQIGF